MELAFGGLHWSPKVFWRSTLSEFVSAAAGLAVANGAKPAVSGPTDAEMAELLARYG